MNVQRGAVLVVDDERGIREMLVEALAEEGYTCYGAASGQEALNLLAKETVDLALFDIVMPGMSGIELFEQVHVKHPQVAVLFVTALADLNTAVENMKDGAYDYITKPIHITALVEKVSEALSRHKSIVDESRNHEEAERRASDLNHHLESRGREVKALNRLVQEYLTGRFEALERPSSSPGPSDAPRTP